MPPSEKIMRQKLPLDGSHAQTILQDEIGMMVDKPAQPNV